MGRGSFEEDEEIDLSDEDQAILIGALKNGFGLTRSSSLIQVTPAQISKYILANPDFHRKCLEALKFSAKALLVMSNTYLEQRKFDKWLSNNQYVKDFVSQLVLWGSYSVNGQVSDEELITCYYELRDIEEVATAVGLTTPKFYERVSESDRLFIFFSERNLL